jgi:hypothetical protein
VFMCNGSAGTDVFFFHENRRFGNNNMSLIPKRSPLDEHWNSKQHIT